LALAGMLKALTVGGVLSAGAGAAASAMLA
jgi:hypothetical protein